MMMMMNMHNVLRLLLLAAATVTSSAMGGGGGSSRSSLVRHGQTSGLLRRLHSAPNQHDTDQHLRMLEDGGATIKYEKCFRDQSGRNLVFFIVCPGQSGCVSQCYGGIEYVADLDFFIAAFAQAQHLGGLGLENYYDNEADACAAASKVCANDDSSCFEMYGCYENSDAQQGQGQDNNKDDQEGEAAEGANANNATAVVDFNVLNYLSGCTAYGSSYYVGPYCEEHVIYMGAYVDSSCRYLADMDNFTNDMGHELEYSAAAGSSLVDETCATCSETSEEERDQEEDIFYYYFGGHGRVQCQELFAAAHGRVDGMYDQNMFLHHVSWLSVTLLAGLIIVATAVVFASCYWFRLHRSAAAGAGGDGSTNDKMVSLLSGWTAAVVDGGDNKAATTVTKSTKAVEAPIVVPDDAVIGAYEQPVMPPTMTPTMTTPIAGEEMPSCQQGFMIMLAEAFDEASDAVERSITTTTITPKEDSSSAVAAVAIAPTSAKQPAAAAETVVATITTTESVTAADVVVVPPPAAAVANVPAAAAAAVVVTTAVEEDEDEEDGEGNATAAIVERAQRELAAAAAATTE
jgi:hypothetical protein